MLIALVLAMSGQTLPIRAADLDSADTQVPMKLFNLAERPSGRSFCDESQKRRQGRAFDSRFGTRFNKLINVVTAREGLGWPSEIIKVMPCLLVSRAQAKRMLDDFDRDLRAYEDEYGLSSNIR